MTTVFFVLFTLVSSLAKLYVVNLAAEGMFGYFTFETLVQPVLDIYLVFLLNCEQFR